MFDAKTIQAFADAGIGVIAIVVVASLFWSFIKLYKETTISHRQERKDWKDEVTKGREETNTVLRELSTVIRESSRR